MGVVEKLKFEDVFNRVQFGRSSNGGALSVFFPYNIAKNMSRTIWFCLVWIIFK